MRTARPRSPNAGGRARGEKKGLSLNIVQLRNTDGERWIVIRLWPSTVVRAFCGPFEDFSFDYSRVGALSAFGGDAELQFADGAVPEPGNRCCVMRGEMNCGTVISG